MPVEKTVTPTGLERGGGGRSAHRHGDDKTEPEGSLMNRITGFFLRRVPRWRFEIIVVPLKRFEILCGGRDFVPSGLGTSLMGLL